LKEGNNNEGATGEEMSSVENLSSRDSMDAPAKQYLPIAMMIPSVVIFLLINFF